MIITGGCIWLWKRGKCLFVIVWAYYLITLLPIEGIVQVGSQAAADRYTYLPSVSIFLLAGIGVAQMVARLIAEEYIIGRLAGSNHIYTIWSIDRQRDYGLAGF